MEGIETGSYPHAMVPGDRKRPPYQRAQKPLKECERKNVALAREKPRHYRPAKPGDRNEHWIGPMQGSKDGARNERRANGAVRCGEEAISRVGVQAHLLQQAERHVSEE